MTVSNALIHSPGKSGVANPLMFNSQRNLHLVAGGPSATLVPAACSTLDRTMPVGAFAWLTIRGEGSPPVCANRRSLFFGGLNLGESGFDRLETLFGKIGVELSGFLDISKEPIEKRLCIFRLNLKTALE